MQNLISHLKSLPEQLLPGDMPVTTAIDNFMLGHIDARLGPRPNPYLKTLSRVYLLFLFPLAVLESLNERGATPYVYNNDHRERYVHYKATFVWTAAFTLIGMASFLGSYGFTNAATRGEAWWGAVDKTYHNAAAVITLGAAIGVTSVAISFLYNAISKLQNKVLQKGQLPGLHQRSFGTRLDSGPPLFSVPFKPFTQIYALSAFAMIIYFTLNPGSYRDFAASGYADVGSVILASLTTAGITGTVATAGQKALSITHDLAARCAPSIFNFEQGSCLSTDIPYTPIVKESDEESYYSSSDNYSH